MLLEKRLKKYVAEAEGLCGCEEQMPYLKNLQVFMHFCVKPKSTENSHPCRKNEKFNAICAMLLINELMSLHCTDTLHRKFDFKV